MKPLFNRSHVAVFVDWSAIFRRFSVLLASSIYFAYSLVVASSSLGAFHEVIRFPALPANFTSALGICKGGITGWVHLPSGGGVSNGA
jgi:hypothetical protein